MRSTFKVLFYLKKNNLNKNGEAPIMARITIDGAIAQFSCKAFIRPDLWETQYNRAIGRSEKAVEINRLLDKIKSDIDQHYKQIKEREGYATAEKVKNAFLGLDMRQNTVLSLLKQHIEHYEKLKKANLKANSTVQKYKNVEIHFGEFLQEKRKRKDIALIELTPELISDFELYLASTPKLAHDSIFTYISSLKRVITKAVKNRLLAYNPFDNYHIAVKETDVGYLNTEEIKTIMKVELTKKLEVVRDLFLFCTFTGLSFCDMRNLTHANKQTFFDDNEWIITRRQKTKTQSNVLLMDIPLKIIDKYEGLTKGEKLLPAPSYTTLNKGIKEIFRIAGIKKHITWHMSRHTYATEICLNNGMPIESLKKTMGHKRISTTERYARVIAEKVSKDMGNLSTVLQTNGQFKYA